MILDCLFPFLRFCGYGLLCFGGGASLIPVYIDTLVDKARWMTLEQFGNFSAISQMTPGPIGVNMATFLGFHQAGVVGAALATIGLLTPGFFLMLLALRSLKKWEKTLPVRGFLFGVRPAVAGMIGASTLIYMGMSVFTCRIPWGALLSGVIPEDFQLRPGALLIFLLSAALLYRTRISIMKVIFASAILGAFLCV